PEGNLIELRFVGIQIPEPEEIGCRLVARDELAGKYVSGPEPSEHGNLPCPAMPHGDGRSERLDAVALVIMRDLGSHRAIAQQVVAHIDKRLLHRLIDEQAAETRAVDEQVARVAAAALRR